MFPAFAADILVDTNVRFQQISGWGATSFTPDWISPQVRMEIIEELARDLRLNRLRFEPPGGNRSNDRTWEWLNDNDNPAENKQDIDWSKFNTQKLKQRLESFIVPYMDAVDRYIGPNAFEMYFSLSFFDGGSTGHVPEWLFQNPEEFAEYIVTAFHFMSKYGITPQFVTILNEAGNNNPFTAQVVGKMIKYLVPELRRNGYDTKIQFPESISAQIAWNYINTFKNDSAFWDNISMISYHLYGSNDPYRENIRDFALKKGIQTAQTEYMNLTIDTFYDDLFKGGVSVWEIYGLGTAFNFKYHKLEKTVNYWKFRQITKYAGRGDWRVGAISTDTNLRCVSFQSPGKLPVTVIYNKSNAQILANLVLPVAAPYRYFQSRTLNNGKFEELGLVDVSKPISIPSKGIVTVYPKLVNKNTPPQPLDWHSEPEFISSPTSEAKLLASAADSDMDSVKYQWRLLRTEDGANATGVIIESPDKSTTNVSGMIAAGLYTFRITFSDTRDTISRDVRVQVFSKNSPPSVLDIHNRIPVAIFLPCDTTILRATSWDLESDKLDMGWKLISQPSGADVKMDTPDTTSCKIRNLKVPGDYVFEFYARDAANTTSTRLTVPVYPDYPRPQIDNIIADHDTINIGDSNSISINLAVNDTNITTHFLELTKSPQNDPVGITRTDGRNWRISGYDKAGIYEFSIKSTNFSKSTTSVFKVHVSQINSVHPAEECFVKVYPLPACDVLTIEGNFNRSSIIILSNLMGDVVFEDKILTDGELKYTINTGKMVPGLYNLTIISKKMVYTSGVVIVH
jgi:hypothetical protein